jgi:tetratricopeptide (TPR) repeat protein
MAKVPLRVYNREIKDLIENGQLEEAIAHCLHILKHFPMHVETYRLLGEALLEARRYSDAGDIFLRILAAVPDDFIAHLGMSIVRESENKLDDAIWHMERAFEMKPSNPAVQGELRRLYGRRDGVEPLKIRLSRDALANMYLQGELYNQAIAELRALLGEDPHRPDLQVMLARACFGAGRKAEAIEMCASLLQKYPYCLDALRIMSELLPGTNQAENAQAYRGRLRQLDPYSAFVSGSVFQSDQVADTTVTLEHLEYQPGGEGIPSHAEWAASLGITAEEPASAQAEIPDWLAGVAQAGETQPGAAQETPAGGQGGDLIPDWMRAAGWGESTGAAQEGPMESGAEETLPAEPATAEIPDWLKAMAPAGVLGPSSSGEVAPPPSEEAPDLEWLKSLEMAQPAGETAVAAVEEEQPAITAAPAEEVPDWLQGMAAESGVPLTEGGTAGGAATASVPAPAEEEVPDWLQGMAAESGVPLADAEAAGGAATASVPAPAEEEVPDWLQGMAAESSVPLAEGGAAGGAATASVPVPAEEEVPDWLQELSAAGVAAAGAEEREGIEGEAGSLLEETMAAAPSTEGTQPMPEESGNVLDGSDALAWLEALAARQGARPDELITNPESRPTQETPDWVQKLAGEAVTPAPPVGESAAGETTLPAAGPGPTEETLLTDESRAEEPLSEEEEGAPSWEIPTITPEPPEPAAVVEQPPAETAPAWSAELLRAESGETGGEAAPAEELPDWLRGLMETETAQPAAAAEEEIPDWLRAEFGAETGAAQPPQPPAAEIPAEAPVEEGEGIPGMAAGVIEAAPPPSVEKEEEQVAPAAISAGMEAEGPEEEKIPAWLAGEVGAAEVSVPSVPVAEEPAPGEASLGWAGKEAALEAETPSAPVAEEPAPEEALLGWAGKEAALEVETPPVPLAEEPAPEEALLGWAGKEAALEVETPPAPVAEEPAPEEALLGWAGKEAALEVETPPAPVAEEPAPEEALLGWAGKEAALEVETPPATFAEEPAPEEALLGWAGKEAALEVETPPAPVAEEPAPEEALLGWAGKEAALEAETPPAPVAEEPAPEEALLGWAGKEAAPGVEEGIPPSPAEEEEPLASIPPPTAPEEWIPEVVAETPSSLPSAQEETRPPAAFQPPPAAAPQPVEATVEKPVPAVKESLTGAQTALQSGRLAEALQEYARLIRKGKFLEEIIHDLREATYRYPVEVLLWQTLGDAYMRANQLQDALDAYTKAEELLR